MFLLPRNERQELQLQQSTQEGIVPQFFLQALPTGCLARLRAHTHTHAGAADAVHACHKTNASSITEKAARNQMGLTAANTMTINCMKYSRLANVN